MRWNAKLELGIDALDRQHKEMVAFAGEVYEAHRELDDMELRRRLLALVSLAAEHFVFEENLMHATNYGKHAVHSEHHAEILGQLERFSQQLLEARYAARGDKLMVFLNDWLSSHIASFDRDFADYLARSGLLQSPEAPAGDGQKELGGE